jgi:hypothetical protein
MSSAVFGRLSKFFFRALLVLLMWVFVDRGTVLADCQSHDLPAIPLSNGSAIGSGSLDGAGERALADLTEIPGRPKPCTGPMCSGRLPMPLAPSTPEFHRIALWAILQVTIPFLTPVATEFRLDDAEFRPNHPSRSVFHPPRLTAPLSPS